MRSLGPWKLMGEADNYFLYNHSPKINVPWYIVFYARRYDCDSTYYAILPLFPFLALAHWWKYARWCLEVIGKMNGWYECAPNLMLSGGRWNFPWRKT